MAAHSASSQTEQDEKTRIRCQTGAGWPGRVESHDIFFGSLWLTYPVPVSDIAAQRKGVGDLETAQDAGGTGELRKALGRRMNRDQGEQHDRWRMMMHVKT